MRRGRWTWALAAAAGLRVVAAMGGAAATSDGSVQGVARFAKIDPALLESGSSHGRFVPASLSHHSVAGVLELADAPAQVRDADAESRGQTLTSADKHAIRQQLQGQQDALRGRLASAGAK